MTEYRTITANGRTLTIAEWATDLGCNKAAIYARLYRGLTDAQAVTPPFPINGIAGHPLRGTPEMVAWRGMQNRCNDTDDPRYGGRGIHVCQRWLNSFDMFFEDMGKRPSESHSIDRINNDGNYACGQCDDCHSNGVFECNCRWATLDVQGRNRHNIRYIECDGERLALLDWADISGLEPETIWRRITSYGWDAKKALTTPSRHDGKSSKPRNRMISDGTKSMTLRQWAATLGLKYRTLRARVERCRTDDELARALSSPLRGRFLTQGDSSERSNSVI